MYTYNTYLYISTYLCGSLSQFNFASNKSRLSREVQVAPETPFNAPASPNVAATGWTSPTFRVTLWKTLTRNYGKSPFLVGKPWKTMENHHLT